ncbi:MAG: hypothetical protein HOH82_25170 [Planctomycetaceae bacterium]|nr:hypothetical protein [Planctomycetaceae bacterium]
MKRIEVPEWSMDLRIHLEDDFSRSVYDEIQKHRDRLLSVVHEAVEKYLNDVFGVLDDDEDDEDEFPSRSKMTGEYYIIDELYRQVPGMDGYQLGIQTYCLEKPWMEGQVDCDYLGLHVWIRWEPKTGKFVVNGNTDSSAI